MHRIVVTWRAVGFSAGGDGGSGLLEPNFGLRGGRLLVRPIVQI
jgi:hypothetical protein